MKWKVTRPKKTWSEVAEKDCQLCKEDAMEYEKWRTLKMYNKHINKHKEELVR